MSKILFTSKEREVYLSKLIGKILKILYLYEDNIYDYKIRLGGLLIDVHSANELLDGEITEILVKLNSIYINKFSHAEIRKIVLECKNIINVILER